MTMSHVVPVCTTLPTTGGPRRLDLIVGIAAYSMLMFVLIVQTASAGLSPTRKVKPTFGWRPKARVALAATWVYLASVVPLAIISLVWEQRSIWPLANPLHGSFALVYGDGFVMPMIAACCTVAWRLLPAYGWHRSPWWLLTSFVIGLLAAAGFHHHVVGAYNAFRYNSLSNLFHDLGAFWVLTGAIVFLIFPVLLMKGTGKWRWIVFGLGLIMLLLLAHEALYPLLASAYHPMANMAIWDRVIHCRFTLPSR